MPVAAAPTLAGLLLALPTQVTALSLPRVRDRRVAETLLSIEFTTPFSGVYANNSDYTCPPSQITFGGADPPLAVAVVAASPFDPNDVAHQHVLSRLGNFTTDATTTLEWSNDVPIGTAFVVRVIDSASPPNVRYSEAKTSQNATSASPNCEATADGAQATGLEAVFYGAGGIAGGVVLLVFGATLYNVLRQCWKSLREARAIRRRRKKASDATGPAETEVEAGAAAQSEGEGVDKVKDEVLVPWIGPGPLTEETDAQKKEEHDAETEVSSPATSRETAAGQEE
ncbi:hypothetical protein JCM1841_001843 [Sporobolomyces salmonicolor]